MSENGGRRVVASTLVTLDGYMVGPDEDMSWVIEGFDPEMQADVAEDMSSGSDVFAFGRVTYEIFAAYWPTAVPYEEGDELSPAAGKEDPRIIRALNDFPKVVFSTTLTSSDWSNTRVVGERPEDEIRRLKAQPGKAVSIQGSASIVQALARADLIDEYRLYVHPVLLGDGKAPLRERDEPPGLRAGARQALRERRRRDDLQAKGGGVMAQYAVLIYERVAPEDLPPEVMEAHARLPERIAEQGGREVAGLALEPNETATSIRGGLVTDGPFIETKEVLAGVFVIEARDLDHALALAKMTPIVDGGVEIRPLLGFEVAEAS
jgi:dihydrofolate reductase